MKNKVPKLRFKEFSDEWEEAYLSEICEILSKKYNPEKEIDIFKCIELEHMSQDSGILLGYCNSKEQKSIKNKFDKGKVLFSKLRPYLKKYWFTEFEGVCSSEIWVMNGVKNKIDNKYLYGIIQTPYFNLLANISSGSKMPRADWNYMSEAPFFYPSLQEQEKIANFLSSVDTKIEMLEKKKELLSNYKKGMMQKLFSQKLRFKDENGKDYPEWEEKKLGEIGEFSKGKNIAKTDISENGFECIRYGELYTKYNEIIREVTSKTDLKEKNLIFSEIGDIIIPASGETAIDLATASCVLKSGVALGGDINIIKTKENGIFLSYYMNSSKKYEIASLAQGISVIHIYNSQLALLTLSIPSLQEQEKIANFLSSIDRKIELVEGELEKNKEFKKGLLQQMFV